MTNREIDIRHFVFLLTADCTENQLGYKMAKWINRIEVVNSFKHIGKGQGGWRNDVLHYYPLDAGL